MTRQTRYFLVASGSILALGLCVGLVAYYGVTAPSRVQPDTSSALQYVPADATVVAFANVREVMDSELRERLRAVEPDTGVRHEFEEQTGIDLETDIDHVVGCLVPGDERNSGLVLLRGRFDAARLEALAVDHGAEVEEHRGRRILHLRPSRAEEPSVVFLESGLALVGDRDSVRHAIDQQSSGRSVATNDELMSLVREIESGHNAWAVGRLDQLADLASVPDALRTQLPALRSFAAGGLVNGGLSGIIRADTRDEQAAQNLRDVLRGFIALAKMQASAMPALQVVIDSFQLGGTGVTVAISFRIPADVIELLGAGRNPAN